jgi:hypothetical protein
VSFPIITRVENQLGGRVPAAMATVGKVRDQVHNYNPFHRMKIVGGHAEPPDVFDRDANTGKYRFRVMEWAASMWFREHWKAESAAVMKNILNRDRHGAMYMRKLQPFLPLTGDGSEGIAEVELYERFRDSVGRQLAA